MMDLGKQELLQERDLQFIKEAKHFLEHSSFLTDFMNYVGKPVDIALEKLPSKARDAISRSTSKALQKVLEWALMTIGEKAKGLRGRLLRNIHTAGAAVTGAVSGAFGMPALLVEIPITTTIMLRRQHKASINAYFTHYFGRAAHYHFGLRRLERQYGRDMISEVYRASQSIH